MGKFFNCGEFGHQKWECKNERAKKSQEREDMNDDEDFGLTTYMYNVKKFNEKIVCILGNMTVTKLGKILGQVKQVDGTVSIVCTQ